MSEYRTFVLDSTRRTSASLKICTEGSGLEAGMGEGGGDYIRRWGWTGGDGDGRWDWDEDWDGDGSVCERGRLEDRAIGWKKRDENADGWVTHDRNEVG